MFGGERLFGKTDLWINGKRLNGMPAELDFVDGLIWCAYPTAFEPFDYSAFNSKDVFLENCEFFGGHGKLSAKKIAIRQVRSVSPGTLSIYDTPSRNSLGLSSHDPYLKLAPEIPVPFNCEFESNEMLFSTGLSVGTVDTNKFTINSGKTTTSVFGANTQDLELIWVALSIALGASVEILAIQSRKVVDVYFGNFGRPTKSNPMFHTGTLMANPDMVRSGVQEVFELAMKYLEVDYQNKFSGKKNAIRTYLYGRAHGLTSELQLLAAFHFLEWFDGSKTISENHLMQALDISRLEARGIKKVRDLFIHNRTDPETAIREGLNIIKESNSERITVPPFSEPSVAFTNYLFSLLDAQFLKRLGYSGRAADYFHFR